MKITIKLEHYCKLNNEVSEVSVVNTRAIEH